jgi:hypothetical protein
MGKDEVSNLLDIYSMSENWQRGFLNLPVIKYTSTNCICKLKDMLTLVLSS